MPEIRLGKLKFLRIETDNEQDAIYALGALRAVRIESVIGKLLRSPHEYVLSVIALSDEFEKEAIDILKHLSTVRDIRQIPDTNLVW